MFSFVGNQKGNIGIVMALTIFGLASGLSLTTLLYKDTVEARLNLDKLQQFFLLRSEAQRGHVVVEKYDAVYEDLYLPVKYVTIISSHSKNTYALQSRIMRQNDISSAFITRTQIYTIKSLVTMKRGSSIIPSLGGIDSMVRSYCERTIRKSTLTSYQYFTDIGESSNGTPVYFWGTDIIYGKVHSNTDIWIKQGGGGNNNGWPTFWGQVSTSGQIQSFNGSPPYAQVFRAGYFEHASPLEFNPSANLIRAHGNVVGSSAYDPNRIMFVTVYMGSYASWVGQIIYTVPDTADVYTKYPPPAGQYLFRNRYANIDTIWASGPCGPSTGHSSIVFSKLWLKGRFQGAQTWCSTDTLYINNDCYLAGTPLGLSPDGSISGSTTNQTDYLGIVSEKSILVQYGYKDPADSVRYRPNCEADAQGIWIYAALCALGDGQGNSHKDGVFTFEYQHPHPSTPAVRLGTNPYVWDKIDLHRYKYPQSLTQPWPSNIDYPWYNPLWPEAFPYMERGSIHLWGSVAQRRHGYTHRANNDPEYPNPAGIWNIPIDFCGGTSGAAVTDKILDITMNGINAPGATGNGVGYKKDYHFDNRFTYMSPPDFPGIFTGGGLASWSVQSWSYKPAPRSLTVMP